MANDANDLLFRQQVPAVGVVSHTAVCANAAGRVAYQVDSVGCPAVKAVEYDAALGAGVSNGYGEAELTELPTPYYQDDAVTLYCADCRDILPLLPKVDLVLTDPPYGIGGKWSKASVCGWKGFKNGSSRLWSKGETWDDSTVDGPLIESVISSGKWAIIWGGNYYGLPPGRGWLVWDKVQEFSSAEGELAWSNLDIPLRFFRMSRVEAYSPRMAYQKTHPTEKPCELMQWCLGFAPDARTILDPFMGSGTTLVAAKNLGRKSIGIEIEERYCEIAAQRLSQGVLDLSA